MSGEAGSQVEAHGAVVIVGGFKQHGAATASGGEIHDLLENVRTMALAAMALTDVELVDERARAAKLEAEVEGEHEVTGGFAGYLDDVDVAEGGDATFEGVEPVLNASL